MVTTMNSPICTATSGAGGQPTFFATEQEGISLSLQTIIVIQGTPIPGGFELSRFLLAEIEITPDGFVIRSGDVDEEGYGSTYPEAYTDFTTSLRDRFHSLKRREARLSSHDRCVLERLRQLLKPVD